MPTIDKRPILLAKALLTWAIILPLSLGSPSHSYGSEGKKKLKRAEKLYSSGKWRDAIAAFQEALKSNPDLPEVHNHLGKALEATNQNEAAVGEYREAVRLEPKNGWYHFDLGSALEETGKESLAANEFQTAVDLVPQDRETFKLIYQGLMEEVEYDREIGQRIPLFEVGGNIIEPVPVYMPEPPYTEEARQAKYQGTTVLIVTINARGEVVAVRLKRSQPMGLDRQAINTVRTWRFKPATKDGIAVPIRVLVEVSFRLF